MRPLEHKDIVPGIIICITTHGKDYWLLSRSDSEKMYFYALRKMGDNLFVKKHGRDNAFLRYSSIGSDKILFVGKSSMEGGGTIYVKPPEIIRKIGKYKITRKKNG